MPQTVATEMQITDLYLFVQCLYLFKIYPTPSTLNIGECPQADTIPLENEVISAA